MTRVLNQLLNWRSLPSKTSFSKAQILDTAGYFLLFQLQNPCVLLYPFEPLSSGFLISPIKPYIIGPHKTSVLVLFILFPMPILFSSFYITTSFSTSQHLIFLFSITLLSLLITTCSDLPALFFLRISLPLSLFSFLFLPQKFLLSS